MVTMAASLANSYHRYKMKRRKEGRTCSKSYLKKTVTVRDFSLRRSNQLRTILDAWGWCTGTTQRDGMGRVEGGGFRMGNTCIPVADSF